MSCKREPILLLAEPSGLPASKARKFSMSVLLCPSVAMESWPRQGAQVSKIQPSCGSGRQPPPCPTLPPRVSPNPIPYMQDTATLTPFPFWGGEGWGGFTFFLSLFSKRNQPPPQETPHSLFHRFQLFIKRLRNSTSNCFSFPLSKYVPNGKELQPFQFLFEIPEKRKQHRVRHGFNHFKEILLPHEPPKHSMRKEASSLAADKHIPHRNTRTASSKRNPGPLPVCGS